MPSSPHAVVLLATALGFGAALAACGADGSDELSLRGDRARGGVGTGEPGASAGNPGAGEPGASGGNPGGTAGGTTLTPAQKARAAFDALLPDLTAKCGSCHKTGVGGSAKWLEDPEPYVSIKKIPGIVVRDYQNSRLLTTGASTGHSGGPGVEGKLKDDATNWLRLEANAMTVEATPGTDPVTVATGANSIELGKAGTGVDGARLTFDAAVVGTTLSLTNLKVSAPATSGVQVTAPLFIFVSGTKETPDPVDSFSNVDQAVPAGQSVTLGPGSALLTGYEAFVKLRITFKSLKAAATGDAGAGGGCKSVATFTQSAAPALNAQCRGCHGGANSSATGAMNLSQLGTNDTAACAQALTKVTLANKANSPIIVRPRPGSGHPAVGGFNQTNHDAAMLGWINNE